MTDATQRMMQMLMEGMYVSQSLYCAAELAIADLVDGDGLTAQQLAERTGTHAPSLNRVLRALASVGVFEQDANGRFRQTPLSATLKTGPCSLRALALSMGAPFHWRAWSGFLHSVRTGGDGWHNAYGVSVFEYFARNPEHAALFNAAMTSFSASEAEAVAASYDFTGIQTLADVGGGHGLLLATVLKANPGMRGILFDLPHVVEGAAPILEIAGVLERCEIMAGDMFHYVPGGADAYLLKHILHDWQDEQALAILQNCRRAMAPASRLLVIEEALPDGNAPSPGKLLDMQMLLIGGKERTAAEYQDLFRVARVELSKMLPTRAALHVMEAVPA